MADVLFVPHGFDPRGGLTIDLRVLANGVTRRGGRVAVAGLAEDGGVLDGLEPAVERIPLRLVNRPLSLATGLSAAVARRPGAVVHLFAVLPSYVTFAALAAARRRGNPVVWTTMFHPARDRAWSGRPLLWPMLAFDRVAAQAVRLADVVAVATDAEAELARARGARRVEFLPPVVFDGLEADAAAADGVRAQHRIGDAPLVTLVCSRDEPRKGLAFGFATFAELRRALPGARLLVVGLDGAAGAGEGVVFAGRVPDLELAASLRAADVVFVPSLYEAFSRVTIEAWQQGSPAIVTDGVGLADEVARHGAGLVVRYGDVDGACGALASLLGDRERAVALGAAGATLVRARYSEDVLLEHARAVYDSLRPGAGNGSASS
ncbi:MAG: glycosyltransferase family 4 protein [Gaiellaceae bacterium]